MDVPKKDPHTLKQLYRAKRAELYAPCPQVAQFERRKRRWFLFLIALCFAVSLAGALFMSWQMPQTGKVLMAAGVIISIVPDLIFLLVAMGTRWQAALTLYLIPPLHLLHFLHLLPPDTTLSTLLWLAVSIITEYPLLAELIGAFHPDVMSVEELFFNTNITTGIAVAHGRGIILYTAEKLGVPIYEYTPSQVKQAVVGYGKAEKRQVMDMTRRLLKLKGIPRPDDAADALALAICHARSATSLLRQNPAAKPTV